MNIAISDNFSLVRFYCFLFLRFNLSLAEHCSVMLSLRKASKQSKKRTTQKQAVIHFLPVRRVHMLWSWDQCRFEVNQIIRALKQSRQRRQQEPHKFAYLTMKNSILYILTMKNSIFCTLCTCIFHFLTFCRRSRSFYDVK